MNFTDTNSQKLAILVSGGLDSAVLLGEAVFSGKTVFPVYVRTGLGWEDVEFGYLRRFLEALRRPNLREVKVLEQPVQDVYGDHWSVTGKGVPGFESRDEAVFLPGRNVFLLAKTIVWCQLNSIPLIAMAPLEANPFPDATDQFFAEFSSVLNRAIVGNVSVMRPYALLKKTEVILRGREMPLQHTFSCISPIRNLHCGACNKCAERIGAFREAKVPDPTVYSNQQ